MAGVASFQQSECSCQEGFSGWSCLPSFKVSLISTLILIVVGRSKFDP